MHRIVHSSMKIRCFHSFKSFETTIKMKLYFSLIQISIRCQKKLKTQLALSHSWECSYPFFHGGCVFQVRFIQIIRSNLHIVFTHIHAAKSNECNGMPHSNNNMRDDPTRFETSIRSDLIKIYDSHA